MTVTDATDAQRNWDEIRAFLCDRIQRQRRAMARLSGDRDDFRLDTDPLSVTDAAGLIALLQYTEQRLDRVFARQSVRPIDLDARPTAPASDTREYQSR